VFSIPAFSQTPKKQSGGKNKSERQAAAVRSAIDVFRTRFLEAYNRQDVDTVA
jgi:hypothetical protein